MSIASGVIEMADADSGRLISGRRRGAQAAPAPGRWGERRFLPPHRTHSPPLPLPPSAMPGLCPQRVPPGLAFQRGPRARKAARAAGPLWSARLAVDLQRLPRLTLQNVSAPVLLGAANPTRKRFRPERTRSAALDVLWSGGMESSLSSKLRPPAERAGEIRKEPRRRPPRGPGLSP